MVKFSGVMPANILPFKADLSIDEAAYRLHLRGLADTRGVTGIVANGHAAEVSSLSREERTRALVIALDEVGSRCPVVAGVYADGTAEAVELARDVTVVHGLAHGAVRAQRRRGDLGHEQRRRRPPGRAVRGLPEGRPRRRAPDQRPAGPARAGLLRAPVRGHAQPHEGGARAARAHPRGARAPAADAGEPGRAHGDQAGARRVRARGLRRSAPWTWESGGAARSCARRRRDSARRAPCRSPARASTSR